MKNKMGNHYYKAIYALYAECFKQHFEIGSPTLSSVRFKIVSLIYRTKMKSSQIVSVSNVSKVETVLRSTLHYNSGFNTSCAT